MLQSWKTFWALKDAERAIAREAAVGLTITHIGLRLLGFGRWKEFVTQRITSPAEGTAQFNPQGSAHRILQLEPLLLGICFSRQIAWSGHLFCGRCFAGAVSRGSEIWCAQRNGAV